MSSGSDRRLDRVELPGADGAEQRRALDELVAGERVQPALRHAGTRVVRAADALQERGDAARRADLAHELDRPDVDPQLERRGGDERRELAGAQPRLDAMAAVLREAAVVRGDDVFAEPLAELVRDPLREPPRVHEHERRAVLAHVRGDAVEHVGHLLRARDRLELALGQLDREVEDAFDARRRRSAGAGAPPRAAARPSRSAAAWPRDRRAPAARRTVLPAARA